MATRRRIFTTYMICNAVSVVWCFSLSFALAGRSTLSEGARVSELAVFFCVWNTHGHWKKVRYCLVYLDLICLQLNCSQFGFSLAMGRQALRDSEGKRSEMLA